MRALIIIVLLAASTIAIAQDSDADRDGIPDSSDRCPMEPEDLDAYQDNDGCPDPDNDLDGVPDPRDKCPDQMETPNGFEDGDGCPDQIPVKKTVTVGGSSKAACRYEDVLDGKCVPSDATRKGTTPKPAAIGAVGTPPTGYRCGPGGTLLVDKGCKCAADRIAKRDADGVAICPKKNAAVIETPTPPEPGRQTPKQVEVNLGAASGDPGGLTLDEITRVLKSRVGTYRACYQKELNRSPGIAGKLVVRFTIGADGVVANAAVGAGSTLANTAVQTCVTRQIGNLKFPSKGAAANISIPMLFMGS